MLDGLAAQELPGGVELEVQIAFDGATPAPEVEQAAGGSPHAVRMLALERVGISAAKNCAFRESTGDLLLFLNDDVEPAPTLVSEHLKAERDALRYHAKSAAEAS